MRVHVHRLPSWAPMAGITLRTHVFLKRPDDRATLEHEKVHVAQQLAHPAWFWVSYLLLLPAFWNPWRVRWEAEAYRVSVALGACTAEAAAGMLSGALYLWPCRRARALAAIVRKD